MNLVRRGTVSVAVMGAAVAVAIAQAPPGGGPPRAAGAGGRGGAPRTVLSVTSTASPDGGELPMKHAYTGENKSPALEFHWTEGTTPASPPEGLQTYAVVFREIETSANRGTADTRHWAFFNIPGTAKGLGFEFFALDSKLDLPATATRDEMMKAMEGHVIGKAAYVGRLRTP